MTSLRLAFSFVICGGLLVGCAQPSVKKGSNPAEAGFAHLKSWWTDSEGLELRRKPNELIVATYNLYNLFDNEFDEGTEDWTFVPRELTFPDGTTKKDKCENIDNPLYRKQCLEIDWTRERYLLKVDQIRRAVEAIGDLPDILAVQEIENEKVAEVLSEALGYGDGFLITNGPDKRGIDVALFYRKDGVTKVSHKIVKVRGAGYDTRDILRVDFKVATGKKLDKEESLSVYCNHWPSQGSPSKSRLVAAETLRRDIEAVLKKKKDTYIIALGDFNTVDEEIPNAFNDVVQDSQWKEALVDAELTFAAKQKAMRLQMAPHSYWWDGNQRWARLDRILFSKNFSKRGGLSVDYNSFRIVSPPLLVGSFTVTDENSFFFGSTFQPVPRYYNHDALTPEDAGFSDHFPVAIKLFR